MGLFPWTNEILHSVQNDRRLASKPLRTMSRIPGEAVTLHEVKVLDVNP